MTHANLPDDHDELIVRAPFDWTEFALCVGKTDIFFGPPGERPSKRRKRETLARSYCAVCPVADTCRDMGRRNYETGIWGGENDEERALAGYPPRGAVRRSIAAAAREGRALAASVEGGTRLDGAGDAALDDHIEAAIAAMLDEGVDLSEDDLRYLGLPVF